MANGSRKVSKVRMKDPEVFIAYQEPHGEDTVTVTVEAEDAPKQSFLDALQGLADHALKLCELPVSWSTNVEARGLTVKQTGEGVGAVISCVKTLSSGQVMSFNSPYTLAVNDNGPELGGDALQAVERLMAEALAYVDGKRAQGQLFAKEDKDK